MTPDVDLSPISLGCGPTTMEQPTKRLRSILPVPVRLNSVEFTKQNAIISQMSEYWRTHCLVDCLYSFLRFVGSSVPFLVPQQLELALVPHALWKDNQKDNNRMRYVACGSVAELRALFILKNPIEMHIGAWYDRLATSDRKVVGTPLRVDLDYECAHTGFMCNECWDTVIRPLVVKVCTKLNELYCCFGARIFAFYTGNRGVHIWVVSAKTNLLPSAARAAVIALLRRTCPEVETGVFDANVSSDLIHTTRMPFTFNPKTMFLMVPINPFDPESLDDVCFSPGGSMDGLSMLASHLNVL